MKHSVLLAIGIFAMLPWLAEVSNRGGLGLATTAWAETKVDISNNESNSTSEVKIQNSSGKSTVCINGECTTSENGDMHIKSENGKINVNVEDKSSPSAEQTTPKPTVKPEIPKPNLPQFDFMSFFQKELQSLRDFFQNIFR